MPRRRSFLAAVLLLAAAVPSGAAPEPPPDAIDDALSLVGLTRSDVGWRAKGWWDRYPDVPYKLRHFDDVLAEPLAVVPWVRSMGAGVKQYLSPASKDQKGVRGSGWLHQAVHDLGILHRFGATRAYSANLTAERTPLDKAILEAYRYAGRPTMFVTFGQESPYPLLEKDLAEQAAKLPKDVSEILGQLVLNLIEARRWADRAFRNVPLELRVAVARRLDLGQEEVDALDYEPAVDDVARLWDEASLWYAAVKTVEALDQAREALAALPSAALSTDAQAAMIGPWFDHVTPLGRVLLTGPRADKEDVHGEGAWLIVDLGGDDVWLGNVAASGPVLPVAAMLDMGGIDSHIGDGRAQGAGVVGVGVLLDVRGDDYYIDRGSLSQGVGQFGFGAVIDLAGDDRYTAAYSGQGCGFFGVGMVLDVAGDDHYEIASDGQGFGGVAGVGVLADRSGKDTYVADPEPMKSGRPSYHTEGKVSVSNAQGCAMGRRGDGADGHSWAGGLGALLDAEGDDTYTAGNWAQGCGYWFGTGVLWDGAGNDTYMANGWASASGAHFCIGALVDESGDDVHVVKQNWGPAFGHDFTVAILADLGGNDRYEAGGGGIAHSINRSVVALIDVGGDDAYAFKPPPPKPDEKPPEKPAPDPKPAMAPFDPKYADRKASSLYWTEPISISLFLDVGGKDSYSPVGSNDATWTEPPDSDNRKARNFSIGVDRAAGRVDLDRPQSGR